MLISGGKKPIAQAYDYEVEKSLLFRGNQTLTRTLGTPTNNRKWTWSGLIKLSDFGNHFALFSGGNEYFSFDSSGDFRYYHPSGAKYFNSSKLFRDPSAWYHVVINYNSESQIANNRLILFVNNIRCVLNRFNGSELSLNEACSINAAGAHSIGSGIGGGSYYPFSGYMSDVYFIDGQALQPSAFGKYSEVTGIWVPKKYNGAYGNNGFYLDFKDNSSLPNLGLDKSGRGNHWTPVNFSLTPGATYDSSVDTLTNNHCNINQLDKGSGITISDGALKITGGTNSARTTFLIPRNGLWYAELTIETTTTGTKFVAFGLKTALSSLTGDSKNQAATWCLHSSTNTVINRNGTVSAQVAVACTNNDVLQIAVDLANDRAWFGRNNVWFNSTTGTTGNPSQGLNPSITSLPEDLLFFVQASSNIAYCNFGQRPFLFTPPAGFKALSTKNFPDPQVLYPEKFFNTKLYIGNGGNLQVGEVQKAIDLIKINQSIRLRSNAPSILTRTPSVTGNRQRLTLSFRYKRSGSLSDMRIFGAGNSSSSTYVVGLSDLPYVSASVSGTNYRHNAARKVHSTGDWCHAVISIDTTLGTAADRVKMWFDGIRSSMSTPNNYFAQNHNTGFNLADQINCIGRDPNGNQLPCELYLADVYCIDGQALDATEFGQWDANGYWVPKTYTGTYGVNGFYLPFTDLSNTTSATLGKDHSGNNNDWTPSGFTVAQGIENCDTLDSPSNNFPILSSTDTAGGVVSNGGLTVIGNSANGSRFTTMIPKNGKWYWEVSVDQTTADTLGQIGIILREASLVNLITSGSQFYYTRSIGFSNMTYPGGFSELDVWTGHNAQHSVIVGETLGIAIDVDNRSISWYREGILQRTMTDVRFDLGDWYPYMACSSGLQMSCNFGQIKTSGTLFREFAGGYFKFDPPGGHRALSENNIAEYTYDIETPDLVWIKSRLATSHHRWYDTFRGPGRSISTSLPNNTAEVVDVNSLIQFNKNGFYLGSNSDSNALNISYVAWMWKRGIEQGMDIVTWIGNGSTNRKINHGLQAVPKLIIYKSTNTSDVGWDMYHHSLGPTKGIIFNNTGAERIESFYWANTAPTETEITISTRSDGVGWANSNGVPYIGFIFTEKTGYSKFGTFNGNGSADGPYIYLGFRPALVIIKRADNTGNWMIYDHLRPGENRSTKSPFSLSPNLSSAEDTTTANADIDLLSNGFKIRGTLAAQNASGGRYIYIAFAHMAAKYSIAA